ncbi:Hypothetical protein D9617_24g016870 [Elsinoe fawcettii]|nr:Hypothetical protein D9617_24g016870 [Elsinoe fawcettii]
MPFHTAILQDEREVVEAAAEYVATLGIEKIKELMDIVNFTSKNLEDEYISSYFELFITKQKHIVQRQVVEQVKYYQAHGSWSESPIRIPESPALPTPPPSQSIPYQRSAWRSGLHRGRPPVIDSTETNFPPGRCIPVNVGWSDAADISEESATTTQQDIELSNSSERTSSAEIVDLSLLDRSPQLPSRHHSRPPSPDGRYGLGIAVNGGDNINVPDLRYADPTDSAHPPTWLKRRRHPSAEIGEGQDAKEDTDAPSTPCPRRKRSRYGGLHLANTKSAYEEAVLVDMTATSEVGSDCDLDDDDMSDISQDAPTMESQPINVTPVVAGDNPSVVEDRSTAGAPARPETAHVQGISSHPCGGNSDDFFMSMPEASCSRDGKPLTKLRPNIQQAERLRSFSVTSSLRDDDQYRHPSIDFDLTDFATPPPFGDQLETDPVSSPAGGQSRSQTPVSVHARYESPLFEPRENMQLPTPPQSGSKDHGHALDVPSCPPLSLQDILDQDSRTANATSNKQAQTQSRNSTAKPLQFQDLFTQSTRTIVRRRIPSQLQSHPRLMTDPPSHPRAPEIVDLTSDEGSTQPGNLDTVTNKRAAAPSPRPLANTSNYRPPYFEDDVELLTEQSTTATQTSTTQTTTTFTQTHRQRTTATRASHTTDPDRAAEYYANGFYSTMHKFSKKTEKLIEMMTEQKDRSDTQAERMDELESQVRVLMRQMGELVRENARLRQERG